MNEPTSALPPPESLDPLDRHDHLNKPRQWPFLLAVLAVLAGAGLIVSGLLWQKLSNIQEELARRSLDSGAQSVEARTLARQAQEATREFTARLALQENRISEVSLQRTQLEELMQSLSRSRDENLVVDIESALRLAQQQAQLTGSAEPLIAALKSASQRLSRAAQPRLSPLQRALAKDTDRIQSASLTDVPVLLIKLDELIRLVDDLPVANAMVANEATRNSPVPALTTAPLTKTGDEKNANIFVRLLDKLALQAWSTHLLDSVIQESRKLLRVSRIDHPEAALMAPEQSFFLRENLKLRLLNARMGLLSRQTDTARSDLAGTVILLDKYFDKTSRRTQIATQLLQQIQAQLKVSELPRIDETMAALATAAAGR